MCIKTKNMLIKILEETPRDITSLMKLSYLIDLSAIRKLGKKISDFRYIRYNYGPGIVLNTLLICRSSARFRPLSLRHLSSCLCSRCNGR